MIVAFKRLIRAILMKKGAEYQQAAIQLWDEYPAGTFGFEKGNLMHQMAELYFAMAKCWDQENIT